MLGPCPACGSENVTVGPFRIEHVGKVWSLAKCEACQLRFTNPSPTAEEIVSFYAGDYHDDLRVPGGTERTFGPKYQRYIDWIARYVFPSARTLDIGCSTGLLPYLLRKRGFEAEGTELNPESAAWGVTHYKVPIHDHHKITELTPGSYALITMTDVLEHTPHPQNFLTVIRRLLQPEGYLLRRS